MDPGKLYEVLLRIYKSREELEFTLRLFLHLLILEFNSDYPVDALLNLFMENPIKLRRIIFDILYSQSRSVDQ